MLQGSTAFRIVFIAAMAVLTLNFSIVFNIEKANPIEKAFVLVAAVVLILRGKFDRTLLAPALFILFATLVSAVFSNFPYFSWDTYARQLINMVSLLIFLITIPTARDRDDVLRVLAFVPLAQVAVGVCYAALGLRNLFDIDSSIGVPRLAGATIPAFLAGFAVVGGLSAMLYADAKRKPAYLWLVAVNGLILMLTAARMASLVGLLVWGTAFLTGFKRNVRLKVYLAIAAVVALPILLALVGEQLLTRAMSGDEKSRDVMRYYLEHYADAYPAFGIGLGHQYTIISRDLIVKIGAVAAHNEYLKYLVELGWVGGLLFAFGWAWLFVATWWSRINTRRTLYFVCVAAFLLYSTTDNTLVRNELSFLIVVAAYGTRLALSDRPLPTQPQPDWNQAPAYRRPSYARARIVARGQPAEQS